MREGTHLASFSYSHAILHLHGFNHTDLLPLCNLRTRKAQTFRQDYVNVTNQILCKSDKLHLKIYDLETSKMTESFYNRKNGVIGYIQIDTSHRFRGNYSVCSCGCSQVHLLL